MKRNTMNVWLALIMMFSCASLVMQPAYSQTPTYINVKDYGAKGNGIDDDTNAINSAITTATSLFSGPSTVGTYASSYPTLYFPSGKYKISGVLNCQLNMMGEASSIIWQSNANCDIVVNNNAFRQTISKLTFDGGLNQISLHNNNIDTSHIVIDKCNFYGAIDCAIRTSTLMRSTLLDINDCMFIKPERALVNYCDKTVMNDCWITSKPEMENHAVIDNYNVLNIKGLVGVPIVNTNYSQRWIDNMSITYQTDPIVLTTTTTLIAENCRFGGEGGGFPAIYNYATYDSVYPVNPTVIILKDCSMYCKGTHPTPCVIYLAEIPNQITMTGCSGMDSVPVLKVDPSLNLNTYFDRMFGPPNFYKTLKYSIDKTNVSHCYTVDGLELPEQMKPYSGLDVIESATCPTTGRWRTGQFVRNSNYTGTGTPFGWVCTAGGQPGTWAVRN